MTTETKAKLDRVEALHRNATDAPWVKGADAAHEINGPASLVAGNYDREEGGIKEESDLYLIIEYRNLTPKLARALRVAMVALGAVQEGEGKFSRDPLTHANNVIEKSVLMATDALAAIAAELEGKP